jgi:phage N-6-adenine-methyltransferase
VSLVNFRAANHPQQTALRGALDTTDDRRTPDAFWLPLNEEHRFTLDAAATAENTKVANSYCTDGLAESWAGERVWCNPPYSDIGPWVAKAWAEMRGGCELVVMLLPANRTEQRWWQDLVEPHRDGTGSVLRVRFLPGRMRFDRPGWTKPAKGDRPPFGCALLVWEAA